MRIIPQFLVSAIMLASQVTNLMPQSVTAQSLTTTASTAGTKATIVLNVGNPAALESVSKPANIETEMLLPIRSYQAEQARIAAEKAATIAAAQAAAKAARLYAAKAAIPKPTAAYTGKSLTDAQIQFLGNCESGMTWNRNSGNGFYGAFQFTISTWNAMQTGYDRADHAPLDVQIGAVQKLLSHSSIYTQFPGCARKMTSAGLI